MKQIIANIVSGGGRTLSYLLAATFMFVTALPSFAADWTDANGNEYTALKYIKGGATANTTGGPWIITDITPVCTNTVKMKFRLANATWGQALWCARKSYSSSFTALFMQDSSASGRPYVIGCARISKTAYGNTKPDTANDCTVVADYNTYKFTVNGTEQSATMDSGVFTVGGPLMLFATHSESSGIPTAGSTTANRGSYKLYYFQLYLPDGTLTHNLMPAQNASGTTGLYDTVGRKFYGPTGGTFTTAARTTVGAGVKWTGLGDGVSMSDGGNWEGGRAPESNQDLDFTLAPPLASINADILGVTFGKLWLDDGDMPTFTGSLTVTAVNFPAKIAGNAAITIAAEDYTWNGGMSANWGDFGVWSNNNAATTWMDNNNAIFNTANAMVTLDSDVTANLIEFNAPANIIDGSSVITVPTVSVASGVTATISSPTVGTLEKTGAGTLVLSQNRTDAATVLSEGTLALSGVASLNWGNFTFGTSPANPVSLDVGSEAMIMGMSYVGEVAGVTNTLIKQGGDWTVSGILGIGKGTGSVVSFIHNGGSLTMSNYLIVGTGTDTSSHATSGCLEVSGGAVSNLNTGTERTIVGGYCKGVMVVKDGGSYVAKGGMVLGNYADSIGSLMVEDGGIVEVDGNISFCYRANSHGTANLKGGGILSVQRLYRKENGTAMLNFDGGTLKAVASNINLIDSNITVFVNANSVIDNCGKNVTIVPTMGGAAGLTLVGSGTTTISADQEYLGATTVSSGTTLSATGCTFAGDVVFESGAAVEAPSIPEGERLVAVLTASSYSGVESLPDGECGNRFFVQDGQLMFGRRLGLMLMVR